LSWEFLPICWDYFGFRVRGCSFLIETQKPTVSPQHPNNRDADETVFTNFISPSRFPPPQFFFWLAFAHAWSNWCRSGGGVQNRESKHTASVQITHQNKPLGSRWRLKKCAASPRKRLKNLTPKSQKPWCQWERFWPEIPKTVMPMN